MCASLRISKLSRTHLTLLVSFMGRGVSAIGSILIVKMAIGLLGVQGYATYAIIASLAPWILLIDAGYGFSLQNHLAETKLSEKIKNNLIVTYVYLACASGMMVLLIGVLFNSQIIRWFFNNEPSADLRHAFIAGLICLVLQAAGSIGSKSYFGKGKAWLINGINAAGIVLALISIAGLKVYYQRTGDVPQVYVLAIACLAWTAIINCVYLGLIFAHAVRHDGVFDKSALIGNVSRQINFMKFSVIATLILNFEALIYARVLSLAELTTYVVVVRLYGGFFSFFSSAIASIWPELTRMYDKLDYEGIRTYLKKMILIGFGMVLTVTFLLILFRTLIFNWFSKGDASLIPSITLLLCFGLYYIIRTWTDTFALLLQSSSNLSILNRSIIYQALLSVPLQIGLGLKFGGAGLVIASTIAFLLTVSWLLPREALIKIKHETST